MADKAFKLECAHCGKVTKIFIEVPKKSRSRKKDKKIQIVRFCEHCNKANILNVPETWDKDPLVLDKDNPAIESDNDVPVIKGEKF